MSAEKRQLDEDDEDFGPMPIPDAPLKKKKTQKVLENEQLYLNNIPSADQYERSLMHRDTVNFVHVTPTDFIITTSIDGHVKFWKKTEKGIEFVKHFRAHLGVIVSIAVSHNGNLLATAASDKSVKIFDVVNFDMISMLKLEFLPYALCWIHQRDVDVPLLAISDKESSAVYLFDGRGTNGDAPVKVLHGIHKSPVSIIKYNPIADVVVSADDSGMLEYWELDMDADKGHRQPSTGKVKWELKSETDLYEFKKCKSFPSSITFSNDYSKFATFGFSDCQVRIFSFYTGRMLRKYDESLAVFTEMQQSGNSIHQLDEMEFGRRLALDRDIEKGRGGQAATVNAIFDESGNFIIYPTLLGIKVVNTVTNKLLRLIGKDETVRFLNLAIYQGKPKRKALEMAASENPTLKDAEITDPTLFCTAHKRNRFYLFTDRAPASTDSATFTRDVFNEKPSKEEQTVAAIAQSNLKQSLGSEAIIHTSLGDITVKLYPEYCPKTVENFVGLAKKGYYDGVIFHRVIKNFMIQTGDPLGDGTGGESLWGHDFEDEFHKALKHDRAYTVSMANSGPNTNGSQFFITTVPTPWLDNKHTIFGRATAGLDVIHSIEEVRTSKLDTPLQIIKIISVDIK